MWTSQFCDIADPIPNSKTNHPASEQGINEHNALGVDLCNW